SRPTLRYGGCNRIVLARLIAVARGPRAPEQSVNQHPRAGARIAVHHQAARIGERGFDGIGRAASSKTSVVAAVHEALHALPAFHQGESRPQQMRVVDSARWVDEMHRRKIALAALGRGDSAHAPDCDRARDKAALRKRTENDVERDTMAAHDD